MNNTLGFAISQDRAHGYNCRRVLFLLATSGDGTLLSLANNESKDSKQNLHMSNTCGYIYKITLIQKHTVPKYES